MKRSIYFMAIISLVSTLLFGLATEKKKTSVQLSRGWREVSYLNFKGGIKPFERVREQSEVNSWGGRLPMNVREIIKNGFGVGVLAGAMIFALVRILTYRLIYERAEGVTLRICHWQLESGFPQSLQRLIDDYEEEYYQIRMLPEGDVANWGFRGLAAFPLFCMAHAAGLVNSVSPRLQRYA